VRTRDNLIAGVLSGSSRQVISALRKGANVNARYRGRTILLWAIQEGHFNIMKSLVRAGASLEARDSEGFTPLDQAVGEGNFEMVQFLLKAGANVNGRTCNGSPLHTACAWCRLKIVKILLAHEANPRALDEDGNTPADSIKPTGSRVSRAIHKLLKTVNSSCDKT